MAYPQANPGIGGLALDEEDLYSEELDLFSKPTADNDIRLGEPIIYRIPDNQLDSTGPYDIEIPPTGTAFKYLQSARLFGKVKVKKIASGVLVNCTSEDFSMVNLPANSLFKQVELYVNNTNVVDIGTSLYHYKVINVE